MAPGGPSERRTGVPDFNHASGDYWELAPDTLDGASSAQKPRFPRSLVAQKPRFPRSPGASESRSPLTPDLFPRQHWIRSRGMGVGRPEELRYRPPGMKDSL